MKLKKGITLKEQNNLTQFVALFSFNFSLKYSVTFFSQSEFGTFWATKQNTFTGVLASRNGLLFSSLLTQ